MVTETEENNVIEFKSKTDSAWQRLSEDSIELLAKAQDTQIIMSNNCEKIFAVIKNIIKYSDQSVFIFVKELNAEVTGKVPNLLEDIRDFLDKKDSKLFIAVENEPKPQTTYDEIGIYSLGMYYPDKFKIKLVNDQLKFAVDSFKKEYNIEGDFYFAVGDNRSYQIIMINDEIRGYGSFNNRNVGAMLTKLFENFSSGSDYFTPQANLHKAA